LSKEHKQPRPMQPYEKTHGKVKQIVISNFIGGISWGLGATVGASIVLALFGIILSKVNLIPIVGDFVLQITNFVNQNNPTLIK